MKKLILLIGFAWVIQSCDTEKQAEGDIVLSRRELISRGEYLVNILDCTTCHSPKVMTAHGPVPDTSKLMSGHPENLALPNVDADLIYKEGWALMSGTVTAFVGPWGTSYAGNLTPDVTGIGAWSEEQFINALKHGKYKGLEGSRPLMPPMPTSAFKHLTDDDVRAIFMYLKTLRPVKNHVPAYEPPVVP